MIVFYVLTWLAQLAVPLLITLVIVWVIIKLSTPKKANSPISYPASSYTAASIDEKLLRAKVAAEIRAQSSQYKTASQKKIVEDMAQTVEYFALNPYSVYQQTMQPQMPQASTVETALPELSTMSSTVSEPTLEYTDKQVYETPWRKLQVLDGAVILLYLGAFFVLSSIGLYVGLGAGNGIKALLVLIITAVFYISGLQLFSRSTRLKPAGLAFAAIGMATLPMAGAALYYFGLNKTNGGLVWLLTSAIAIAMYANALYKLRSTLVSYMVVFSTLSVVLSSISVLGLASFYFIQAMGIAGVLFVGIARILKNTSYGIGDAYDRSAVFLVPFSVGMSVLFVVSVGWLQLSLSLLVGALYYGFLWAEKGQSRHLYAALAQVMGIATVITALYGLVNDPKVVAFAAASISVLYAMVWLLWAQYLELNNAYRKQVKSIILCAPLVSLTAVITTPKIIWMPLVVATVLSALVYIRERDTWSGIGWFVGMLALPSLIGFVTMIPGASASSVSLWYLGILALCAVVQWLASGKMRGSDTEWQQSVLVLSLVLSSVLQLGAPNPMQSSVLAVQIVFLLLHALTSGSRTSWLLLVAGTQLSWIGAFFDSGVFLTGFIASVCLLNLAIVRISDASKLHDWLAGLSVLVLPVLYGILVATPDWGARAYFAVYTGLFVLFILVRRYAIAVDISVSTTVYLFALISALISAYFVSPELGLGFSVLCIPLCIYIDYLESSSILGFLVPLLPLLVFFHGDNTLKLGLLAIVLSTVASLTLAIFRKRTYEALLTVLGTVILPWYAGALMNTWTITALCSVYLALSALYILGRQASTYVQATQFFVSAIRFGYIVTLCISTLYAIGGTWQLLAVALFASGLLITAASYIEHSPPTIVLSFMYGYASILSFSYGSDLSLPQTVALCIALSQGTYWILRFSGLDTVRAMYARNVQLVVALVLPCIGLSSPIEPIYPIALALFSLMLMRETWINGQNSRELAILLLHSSILWLLYAVGLRELQVFTQLTALLIASFALWRRNNEDTPSVINSYLWTAVLIFSVPMVWQAIASSNTGYAYLVLVEHIILILVSIMYKRATFAWWGIAVVVASVLYQLRKLRYAALAFLGVFIISLAVYFLLRYNKPGDQPPK